MPTSARLEVANLPKNTVKTVHSAGPMRCPQASFEAQPRIARLLAPKMGIGPYIQKTGSCGFMIDFRKMLHSVRADRVVRPYADFSFVKQSTTKRTRLQCGKSAQYLLFGEFMLQ